MVTATHDLESETLSLIVDGDLLSTNAETGAAEIDARLAEHDARKWKRLHLDLKTARMVDSVGLNVIIGLVKRMQKKKRPMVVSIASPSVKRVFEFSRLTKFVEIYYKRRRGW